MCSTWTATFFFAIVFQEFDGVLNLKIIYAVVGCLSVGAMVLLFCAVLSFYNEFTKSSYVILGSAGLYIVNGVACKWIKHLKPSVYDYIYMYIDTHNTT